jgi:hypothetical protein
LSEETTDVTVKFASAMPGHIEPRRQHNMGTIAQVQIILNPLLIDQYQSSAHYKRSILKSRRYGNPEPKRFFAPQPVVAQYIRIGLELKENIRDDHRALHHRILSGIGQRARRSTERSESRYQRHLDTGLAYAGGDAGRFMVWVKLGLHYSCNFGTRKTPAIYCN